MQQHYSVVGRYTNMLTLLLRPSSPSQDPAAAAAAAMATESSSSTLAPAVKKAAEEGNVAQLWRLRVGEAGGVPVDAVFTFR